MSPPSNAEVGGENQEALERKAREVFATPGGEGKYLYHYTRLAVAIEDILPSLRLRFSRFSNMRDPRETQWAFAASYWGEDEGFDEHFLSAQRRLHEIKSSVRLISLSRDRASEDAETDPRFGRGYAHPRLWEQYAGDHTGVCLCFSIPDLIQAVNLAASRAGGQFSEHGEVKYRDRKIGLRASNIDLNAVATLGTDPALLDLFEVHKHDLFFTKLKDWETEMEYRFLTYWDDPGELYVDVSSALHAIVAGHAVRAEYGPSLRALCNPEGIVLARMHWENGLPKVLYFPERLEARAERFQPDLSQPGL